MSYPQPTTAAVSSISSVCVRVLFYNHRSRRLSGAACGIQINTKHIIRMERKEREGSGEIKLKEMKGMEREATERNGKDQMRMAWQANQTH